MPKFSLFNLITYLEHISLTSLLLQSSVDDCPFIKHNQLARQPLVSIDYNKQYKYCNKIRSDTPFCKKTQHIIKVDGSHSSKTTLHKFKTSDETFPSTKLKTYFYRCISPLFLKYVPEHKHFVLFKHSNKSCLLDFILENVDCTNGIGMSLIRLRNQSEFSENQYSLLDKGKSFKGILEQTFDKYTFTRASTIKVTEGTYFNYKSFSLKYLGNKEKECVGEFGLKWRLRDSSIFSDPTSGPSIDHLTMQLKTSFTPTMKALDPMKICQGSPSAVNASEENSENVGNSSEKLQKQVELGKIKSEILIIERRFSLKSNEHFIETILSDPCRVDMSVTLFAQKKPADSLARGYIMSELLVQLLKSFVWPSNRVKVMWVKNLDSYLIRWMEGKDFTSMFPHQNSPEQKFYEAAIMFSSDASLLVRHLNLVFFHNLVTVLRIQPCKLLVLRESPHLEAKILPQDIFCEF
uniref:Uncharacterized protein n=1 Tax=Timema poppense TaxID=170557 RepID=A0A7R9CW95_TIMPO|nr:unnamed protein product [Timema poppensis]